jgi:hypothetical protein
MQVRTVRTEIAWTVGISRGSCSRRTEARAWMQETCNVYPKRVMRRTGASHYCGCAARGRLADIKTRGRD